MRWGGGDCPACQQDSQKWLSHWGAEEASLRRLEFVSQRKLHDTRLGQQAGVGAEAARRMCKRREQGCSHALGVEARQVWHVEHFPTELQAVGLPVGHLPAFGQAHVPTSEAIATQKIARADSAREG